MSLTDYDVLDQVLSEPRAPLGAAEAHGVLCGGLTAAERYTLDRWIAEVQGGDDAALLDRNVLAEVYATTARALDGPDMEFAPLLPNDETPLEQRVHALSQWCNGYLYGLGVGRMAPGPETTDEVEEVLKDFTEISRAGVDTEDAEEVNEEAYAELVEFVRAGTQLLYEELAAARVRPRTH